MILRSANEGLCRCTVLALVSGLTDKLQTERLRSVLLSLPEVAKDATARKRRGR